MEKTRIFYEKMLESGSVKDIQTAIISQLNELNKHIDYINFRFDTELPEFKNSMGKIDEIKARKWIAYLES